MHVGGWLAGCMGMLQKTLALDWLTSLSLLDVQVSIGRV